MFWQYGYGSFSSVSRILSQGNFTLETLLTEPDIVQETHSCNDKLIEYFLNPETLEKFITLLVEEPHADLEETKRYLIPSRCSEILSYEGVPFDKISLYPHLYEKLWSFFCSAPPLNPLSASFCCKVFLMLLKRRPLETVEFLKSVPNFVDIMIKHLETSSVMVFMQNFLCCVDKPGCELLKYWLQEKEVIPLITKLLLPIHSDTAHIHSAELLCEIIKVSRSREDYPFPFDEILLSTDAMEILLAALFSDDQSSFTSASSLFLVLLNSPKSIPVSPSSSVHQSSCAANDSPEKMTLHKTALDMIVPHLPKLQVYLMDPPDFDTLQLSSGLLDPPLGRFRLQVVELVSFLVSTNYSPVLEALTSSRVLETVFSLFFKYHLNNILHIKVLRILTSLLNQPPPTHDYPLNQESLISPPDGDLICNPLLVAVFEDYGLVSQLMSHISECEHKVSNFGCRKGNIVFIVSMCNRIQQALDASIHKEFGYFSRILSSFPLDWESFVSEELALVNILYTKNLRTSDPQKDFFFSKDEGHNDGEPHSKTADVKTQLAFNKYLAQQLNGELPDDFGFQEDDDDDDKNSRFHECRDNFADYDDDDDDQDDPIYKGASGLRSFPGDDEWFSREKFEQISKNHFPDDFGAFPPQKNQPTPSSSNPQEENWAKFDKLPATTLEAPPTNNTETTEDGNWANFGS